MSAQIIPWLVTSRLVGALVAGTCCSDSQLLPLSLSCCSTHDALDDPTQTHLASCHRPSSIPTNSNVLWQCYFKTVLRDRCRRRYERDSDNSRSSPCKAPHARRWISYLRGLVTFRRSSGARITGQIGTTSI